MYDRYFSPAQYTPNRPGGENHVINDVLRANGIRAHVTGGVLSPASAWYSLSLFNGQRIAAIAGLEADVAARIHSYRSKFIESPATVMVRTVMQPYGFDISREDRRFITFPAKTFRPDDTGIFCGYNYTGGTKRPKWLWFEDTTFGHVLIAGATRSGKSSLMRLMMATAAFTMSPDELRIVVIDMKGGPDLSIGEFLPHTTAFARDMDAAEEVVSRATEVMRKRAGSTTRPRMLIFIDEAATFALAGRRDMTDSIALLAQVGAGSGIHLVVGFQKPTADVVNTLAKANMTTRIVGTVASATEASVAMGLPGTGAEALPGQGSFLMRDNSQVWRIEVPFLSQHDGEIFAGRIREKYGTEPVERWLSDYVPVQYSEPDVVTSLDLAPPRRLVGQSVVSLPAPVADILGDYWKNDDWDHEADEPVRGWITRMKRSLGMAEVGRQSQEDSAKLRSYLDTFREMRDNSVPLGFSQVM